MKLKTFIKEQENSIIDVYCQKSFNESHNDILIHQQNGSYYGTYYDWDVFLSNNKIIECFNNRYFTNINGKSHTIILENDTIIPNEIDIASKFTQSIGLGKLPNILQPFLHLSKSSNKAGYDKYLYDYIKENKIKNVFIDSTFSDKEQFELIAKNVFRWTIGVNLFINSHSTLLDTLNNFYIEEDFKKLTDVCNVYDIDFTNNLVYKIEYDFLTSKFHKKSKYYINWGVSAK